MATVRRLNAIRQALTSIEQPLQIMGAHLQSENGDIVLSITHAANENNGAVRVVLVSYGEPIPILIPDESMDLDLVCQSIVAEAQIAHDRHNTRPLPFITQFTQVLEQLRTTHFQQLGLNLIEAFGHIVASRYAPDGGLATSCVCAVSLIEDPSVIREIVIARNLSILEATRLVITEARSFRNSYPPVREISSNTLREFREFFDSTYREAFTHYGFTVGTALHSPNIIQFHFSNGAYNNSHQVILTDRLIDVERGLFDKLREMLNQLISLSGLPSEVFSARLFGELRILHEPMDLRAIVARHSMTNPDVNSLLQDLPVFTRGYTPIAPAIFGAARPAGRTVAGFQQVLREGVRRVSSRAPIATTRTRQPEGEGSAVAPPGQVFEIARNASERIDALVLENWAVDRGFGGIEVHTLSVDEMAEMNRGLERENLPPRRIRKNDSE